MRIGRLFAIAALCAGVLDAELARGFVWPSTVDRVGKELRAAEPAVRRRAALALFQLPPRAIARLATPALNDADPDVRVAALEALLTVRAPRLAERVAPWLGDGDARVRRAAAAALFRLPYPPAVPALGRVLSDPDASVRVAAANALGVSGAKTALVPLLGRIDDVEPEVREAVARALARLGDSGAVVPLIGKIQDTRPNVRKSVAAALGVLGDPRAEGALLLLLRDADEAVRVAALGSLGRIKAADAAATVTSLLSTERRPAVREAALLALADMPPRAALDALVRALGEEDPRDRSPVRAALVHAGARAVPVLTQCLEGQPAFDLGDGCALALGEIGAPGSADLVIAAFRRGVVRPAAALNALAAAGDRRALPTVFEYLSAEDAWVRRAALEAAVALLDPAEPDGRAVEPIARALDAAHERRSERAALVELLGRTGSPRAAPLLSRVAAGATDPSLRLAAIVALGSVGRAGQDAALLAALSDDDPRLRLAAALSLRKTGAAGTAGVLIERLERAAEQDRDALAIALAGPLAATSDRAVVEQVVDLARRDPSARRDALVEAAGAAPGALSTPVLAAYARQSADASVRAKVAEALAGKAEARSALLALARDGDASVRANAVWSLGSIAGASEVDAAKAALGDPDAAVAGNAAALLGRLLVRGVKVAPLLCSALAEGRAYVRANALVGLALAGVRCPDGEERPLIDDGVDLVRRAAARLLAVAPTAEDRGRLTRCADEEPSPDVAAACASPRPKSLARGTASVSVFVVPAGATDPLPRAPFALVLPDGFVRLGQADLRGSVFERDAPRGTLRLALAAPFVP